MTDISAEAVAAIVELLRYHDMRASYADAADLIEAMAAQIADLTAKLEATLKDRAFILTERDRTFALMLARAEAAEARCKDLETALEAYKTGALPDLTAAWLDGAATARDRATALARGDYPPPEVPAPPSK